MPWEERRACKKRELLSLIGSKIVRPGRIFLRKISCKGSQLDYSIRFTEEFRSDLAWWGHSVCMDWEEPLGCEVVKATA